MRLIKCSTDRAFRPPLTPPNLGGELDTLHATFYLDTLHATFYPDIQYTTFYLEPMVVTISPPKLGGARGGLNKHEGVGNFSQACKKRNNLIGHLKRWLTLRDLFPALGFFTLSLGRNFFIVS